MIRIILKDKKVIVLSVGGFENLIELDKNGICEWCKNDNACARTALRCLDSLKFFSNQLDMNVVGELYAIHGDPAAKENELIELGKNITK